MSLPSDIHALLIILGAVFVLIGLLGGGLEVSALKIPPATRQARVLAAAMGIVFLMVGILPALIRRDAPAPRNLVVAPESTSERPRASSTPVAPVSPSRLSASPRPAPPPAAPHAEDAGLAIDDADPVVRYSAGGGWKTDPDYHLLNSTQHYTSNPGSTATLDFRGDWIEVAFYRERGGAIMSVNIDGTLRAPIDCGSPSGETRYQQVQRFTRIGPGAHRMVLTHTGTPPDGRPARSFGDYTVNVDGFRVASEH
jgi:hypothetical protein